MLHCDRTDITKSKDFKCETNNLTGMQDLLLQLLC